VTRQGAEAAEASVAAEFERIYRANIDAVTAYFARRTTDPQLVADLTADTFVTVITSFESFDPRKGSVRAWVFGIARHIYAGHCEACSHQRHKLERLAGRRELDQDEVEELLERIDAERSGHGLIAALEALPEHDRAVIELVDVAGLRPKDAATVLGVSPGTVRMRLMRARTRLRRQVSRPAPAEVRRVRTGPDMAAGGAFTNQMRVTRK
jgi:RNA polymerase sigma factor (sigma-70 family)